MGFAIAETCAQQGANVILITGPVSLVPIHSNIKLIRVQTAKQMFDACKTYFSGCDSAILSAAVADFSPEITYTDKVKRGKEDLRINLKPTLDIAAELGSGKTNKQILVGFALETENELENARTKLRNKNFDFIVINSLKDEGAGFGTDTNKITILDKNNNIDKFELKSKAEVSADIVEKLIGMMR
jgi:phosphopantothenoylcysteine decarboxylase / phosphopantothenate---cysteine ligase